MSASKLNPPVEPYLALSDYCRYLFVMAEVEAREHKIKYSTIAARRTNLTYWIYEQGLCKNPPAARLLHKETNKLLEWMSKTLDIFDFDSDAIHIN